MGVCKYYLLSKIINMEYIITIALVVCALVLVRYRLEITKLHNVSDALKRRIRAIELININKNKDELEMNFPYKGVKAMYYGKSVNTAEDLYRFIDKMLPYRVCDIARMIQTHTGAEVKHHGECYITSELNGATIKYIMTVQEGRDGISRAVKIEGIKAIR